MVNIMLVDDHSLMRRAVREVIEQENDLAVVAEASNGLEAEILAQETQPDVVLMDLAMPDCDGFEATERVLERSPRSRVVIFTASRQEQHVFYAMQRGAIGYITKDIEPNGLIEAIRRAAHNDLYIAGSLAVQVLAHLRLQWQTQDPYPWHATLSQQDVFSPETNLGHQRSRDVHYQQPPQAPSPSLTHQGQLPTQITRTLTEREHEILDLMRRGRKNREIADALSIAQSTVHKHVQNIFEKLHVRNRAEAIYLTTM